ncbi:restriction endonuclease subunit S [Clostridium sp.]|uniref:restriction endonuclease subunit S n=1 Tax=Clostridium sp. TaxID=1506 RepID=UPI003D6D0057
MKINWKEKKLWEICQIELGKTPSRSNKKFWDIARDTGNVWLSIADLLNTNGNVISDSKEYISEEGAKLSKIVKKGTLLVSFKLTLGRLAFAGIDLYTNEAIAALSIKNDEELSKGFLYYFLSYFDWDAATEGDVKIKGRTLNKEKLKAIDIQLPPLNEQNHIVDILDMAFDAIARAKKNAENNLQNAREIFETYLQSVFVNCGNEWQYKTLSQVSNVFGRGKSRHRPRNDKKLYNGKYPFIQTGNIRNCNHYITEYFQTYNDEGLAQSKLWPKGTICITIAANIAETGILSFDACFPDSIIGIVLDPKLAEINFVEYLLQSFKAKIQAKGKGSAQANINLGTFENELFPFPPLNEQKCIVTKIKDISIQTQKLEAIYQQKLDNLEELKKSILQKAFNGEL